VREVDDPDYGSLPDDLRAGIAVSRAASYAVERRRGWTEAPGSPPRAEGDIWDERRVHELGMEKRELSLRGAYAAFRTPMFSREIAYCVGSVELPDVQWADWARDGRLLVATRSGRLETRAGDDWTRTATRVADLSLEAP
jgi:hypothetical protein